MNFYKKEKVSILDANKAYSLYINGKYDKALKIYKNLHKNFQQEVVFINQIAFIFLKLNLIMEAIKYLKKSLAINGKQLEINFNLAVALSETNQLEESIIYLDNITKEDISNYNAYFFKGCILRRLEQYQEALIYFQMALKLRHNDINSIMEIALIHRHLGSFKESILNYDEAIKINPLFAPAFYNKALTLDDAGDTDTAIKNYDEAIRLNPNFYEAYINKAQSLEKLFNLEEALLNYEKAIQINPNIIEPYLAQSFIHLSQCNFNLGWESYNFRFLNLELNKKFIRDIYLKSPEDLNNFKNIFIFTEQGVGDHILFSSLFAELSKLSSEIYIEVDERLYSTFQRSFSGINFVTNNIPQLTHYDACFGLASLPSIFRKNIESFDSQKFSYLKSNALKTASYRERLLKINSNHKICGISWKSQNKRFGIEKSIDLSNFQEILNIPNIIFINLQYGVTDNEIEVFNNKYNTNIQFFSDIDHFNDLESLFSLVDACDFVVTGSNVTSHIAGSLGKQTFLIAPISNARIWYWHRNFSKCLWYPTVNIFSQSDIGVWSEPIREIKREILNAAK